MKYISKILDRIMGKLIQRKVRELGSIPDPISETVRQIWMKNEMEVINTRKIAEIEQRVDQIEKAIRNVDQYITEFLERAALMKAEKEKPN